MRIFKPKAQGLKIPAWTKQASYGRGYIVQQAFASAGRLHFIDGDFQSPIPCENRHRNNIPQGVVIEQAEYLSVVAKRKDMCNEP